MKVSTTEDMDDKVLSQSLKHILLFLKLNGYYLGRESSGWRTVSSIILTVINKLFVLYNLFRYVVVFIGETELSGSLTSSLAMFTFYLYIAYLTLALTFSLPRNFWKFIDLFQDYISDYGAAPYLPSMRWKFRKFVVSSSVFYVAFLVTFTVSVNNTFPTVQRHMAPLNSNTEPRKTVFIVLYIFLMWSVCLQLVSAIAVSISTTYMLFKEFSILSKKLGEEGVLLENNLDQFYRRHERLCVITTQANCFVTHVIFATYTFGIPMLCFLSFGLIKGSLPFDEFIFCSGNLLTIIILMILVTAMACVLSDKANEPLKHLFRSDWSTFSEKTLHKMTIFIGRLSSEKIGYTVYGLFTVDRSTILMIVGTIVTYEVVVLQIQTGRVPDCDETCPSLKGVNLTQICHHLT